ncbi:MAG: OOP family OmpA-OmpF porin [Candidatus Endobugula sp.]|jgi:OOP family OmpA-OmpF porin
MTKKLITIAAIALTSALSSIGVSAHVANGGLVSGNGNVVSSTYTDCVKVSLGVRSDICGNQIVVPVVVPVKVVNTPLVAPKAVSRAVTLSGDASFSTDSSALSANGKAALNLFATRAKQLSLSGISVVGHADSRGETSYNQKLSERRASSVKTYLEAQGVLGSLIRTEGEGENSPVATNNTKAGRAQNRRVDIIVRGYTKTK